MGTHLRLKVFDQTEVSETKRVIDVAEELRKIPSVIRVHTQKKFNKLIASPNWLGATTVIFDGINGGFVYDAPDNIGIIVPQTVKGIVGVNNATILVSNCKIYYDGYLTYAFWYRQREQDTYIRNITVKTENCPDADVMCEFYNFSNMYECKAYTATPGDHWAIIECENLYNCFVSGNDNGYKKGFQQCKNLFGCSTDKFYGTSFEGCENVNGCIARGTGYGFYDCTHLLNCLSMEVVNGSSYFSCLYASNCSGIGKYNWKGTNVKIDMDSCSFG